MTNVHLVGSIGLDTVPEVLAAAGKTVGPFLKRVPDGEVGGRRLWISFQYPVLRGNPFLQPDTSANTATGYQLLRVANDVKPEDVRFGELGYAREARASYEDFRRARDRGDVPPHVRFQVCLPTPLAVVGPFCTAEARPAIEPAYEKAMLREVEAICIEIPHRDLTLQWDICIEMIMWDGRYPRLPAFPGMEQALAQRFARLSQAVPPDVELGFHLCYGNFDAKHFIEPVDATKMVELSNLICASVKRSIAFIHMPVPINWDQDAFYAPLSHLKLPPGTELYLGLVHAEDGAAGTRKRMGLAGKFAPEFGIATECGFSRGRKPEIAHEILRVHAEVARG